MIGQTKKIPSTDHEIDRDIGTSTDTLGRAEKEMTALLAETRSLDDNETAPALRASKRLDIAKTLAGYRITDALAFLYAFLAAWLLASVINMTFLSRLPDQLGSKAINAHFVKFLLIAAGALLWFEHAGHYRIRMPFWLEAKKIFAAVLCAMMFDGFLFFAMKQDFSRLWLTLGWAFAGIGIIAFRSWYRAEQQNQGRWHVPTLLVGKGRTAENARTALRMEPALGYNVVAQIGNLPEAFAEAGDSWEKLCANYGADYIVIALDSADLTKAELPLAQLVREPVPFSVVPPLRHIPVFGATTRHYFINHDIMLMTRNNGLEQPIQRLTKRTFDLVVATLGLFLIGPMMALLSGKNVFRGFLDVIEGKRSLVGPQSQDLGPAAAKASMNGKHKIRPGITGLWRMNKHNEDATFKHPEQESWYVHNWSLWHDIAILGKTVMLFFQNSRKRQITKYY